MATEFRKSGISVVGDAPWGTHFCHFYETKQDLLDTLIPYFKAGLESREFCLWVVSDVDLITVEEAKGALALAVPNLARHFADESLEILSGHDWYFEQHALNLERAKHGWDAKLKRALARGYEGLRVSADTFWLAEKDWKDFLAYEKQVNDWVTNQSMTVMCTYPLAKSGATEVLDVVQAHQFAIARRQGEWEVIETPEPIQARAEIRRLHEELQRDRKTEPPAILKYGVAVLSVIVAISIARWMEISLHSASHVSLFLCAVMFTAWFGGIRPGALSIVLSLLAFDYFVLPPIYSFAVETNEIPRLLMFFLSALFLGCLSAAQRSKAASLRRARDVLNVTVEELKRTNVVLQGENADRKRAEDQLKATTEQLRSLSARLQSAREQEGVRIARELHDELGAALSSLKWDLEEVVEVISGATDLSQFDEVTKRIEAVIELTDTTVNFVRRIASELRPIALDELGLSEAIEFQARQFQERTGIVVQCDCDQESVDLNGEQSTAVFRIFQEALTNILRHAQATTVQIQLHKENGAVVLTISDNGRGITDDEKSGQRTLGLLGIRERAHLIGGTIEINGPDGKGTVITVRVPISH
jgi:signal transduction histidine kinase